MTNPDESERIAELTSNAILVTGEKVCKEIMSAVLAAEDSAKSLRADAEALIAAIEDHTKEFAERVNAYVVHCHDAVSMFQEHQSKILDMEKEISSAAKLPPVTMLEMPKTNGTGHG